MKKMIIVLAGLSLVASSAMAATAPKAPGAKPIPSAPGLGSGAINAPGVGQPARTNVGASGATNTGSILSNQSGKSASGAGEAKGEIGGSCENSILGSLPRSAQADSAAARTAGIGGGDCLKKFDSPETVAFASRIQNGGYEALRKQGLKHVSQTSKAQAALVADGMADVIEVERKENETQALDRLEGTCKQACDVASKTVCDAIPAARVN
jgi:hypothetical protein